MTYPGVAETADTPTDDNVFEADQRGPNPNPPQDVTATAEVDGKPAEEKWPHATMEYKGETYEIRIPDVDALTGLQMASSKSIPMRIKLELSSKFVYQHLSPTSWMHIMERLTNPDDTGFTHQDLNALTSELNKLGNEAAQAAADGAAKA